MKKKYFYLEIEKGIQTKVDTINNGDVYIYFLDENHKKDFDFWSNVGFLAGCNIKFLEKIDGQLHLPPVVYKRIRSKHENLDMEMFIVVAESPIPNTPIELKNLYE